MVKLRIGPFLSVGVKNEKLPKEGVEIVKYIEDALDGAVEELVESFDITTVRKSLRAAVKDHFCKTGIWATYFTAKVVVTHDWDAHKRNVEKFNRLTLKEWNEL